MGLSPLHKPWVAALLVGIFAMLFLQLLEVRFVPEARDGLYYQELTSERMMQTVSIRDLKEQPLISLWNIHIQPPGFDLIRAALAWIWRSGDRSDFDLLRLVDKSLYELWIVLYGVMAFILCLWISALTRVWFGVCATLLFLMHPACILYASFLDTTFLTATLILWLYYLLWRLKEHRTTPVVFLILSIFLLFLTRPLFQWPFLLVLAGSLFLMKVPTRTIVISVGIAGIAIGAYTAKQAYQFGLPSTTSFTGLNLVHSIGLRLNYANVMKYVPQDRPAEANKPKVLTRNEKIDGSVNFNHERFLVANRVLQNEYFKRMRSASFTDLAKAYAENLGIYLGPSSRYTNHIIVNRLPWRSVYDSIFSAPVLPLLIALACIVWMASTRSTDFFPTLGLCLPLGFIVLASVLGEHGENMRFKFFIEPVLYVFLSAQLYSGAVLLFGRRGAPPSNGGFAGGPHD
jgi:hypothetical protein